MCRACVDACAQGRVRENTFVSVDELDERVGRETAEDILRDCIDIQGKLLGTDSPVVTDLKEELDGSKRKIREKMIRELIEDDSARFTEMAVRHLDARQVQILCKDAQLEDGKMSQGSETKTSSRFRWNTTAHPR